MMNLPYPPNAQMFAQQIIKILNIDVLDPEYIYDLLRLNFDSEDELIGTIND